MPHITLPDGKKIKFKEKINGSDLAEKISKSLSKDASIMEVDGELKDLGHEIVKDSSEGIICSILTRTTTSTTSFLNSNR